jgi:hypothetical protein
MYLPLDDTITTIRDTDRATVKIPSIETIILKFLIDLLYDISFN